MGRELRRVPMDFDWPIGQVWEGYLAPEWRPCPAACEHGETVDAAWVGRFAQLILMLGYQHAERSLHPWLQEVGAQLGPLPKPTERMAEVTGGLAGRAPRGRMGHDAIDRWKATKAIYRAAGLDEDWGTCPTCKGHAMHPDDVEASEAWESTDPPAGDGYQLWETTSEGSPKTPVFATIEELCNYAAEHCTTFASFKATAEEWRSMLEDNFVRTEMQAGDGTRMVFL